MKSATTILSVLLMGVCILLTIGYAYSCIATISRRSGLSGNMHHYYQLTIVQYASYTFCISIIGLLLIGYQLKGLIERNDRLLYQSRWMVLVYLALIVVGEWYLSTRFVGKG